MLNVNPVNLICVVINILVLYLIVRKLLFQRVLGVIEQRKAMIREDFDSARAAKEEALALKQRYEETMKTAGDESARILIEARQTAVKEQQKIVEQADLKAAQIIENAKKSMETEREKTLQDTQDSIASLAMLAAAKIMGKESSRQGGDTAIYDEFLEKVGDQNDAGSH